MRSDDDVAVLAGGERNGDGRWQATLGSLLVEHLTDGADVNGIVLQHFDEGVLESIGAGRVEELEEPRGVAAEIFAALGEALQKSLAARSRLGESIQATMLAGTLFLRDQALQVSDNLELLAAIPGAGMGRNDLVAFGDANGVEVGEDRQSALSAIMWNRVVVEIKASIGSFSNLDVHALMRRERLVR